MTTKPAFSHLENRMLRYMLESEPRHVSLSDLRAVIGWTAEALGRDVMDLGVPRQFVEARAEFARRADKAVRRGERKKAHAALANFWSV